MDIGWFDWREWSIIGWWSNDRTFVSPKVPTFIMMNVLQALLVQRRQEQEQRLLLAKAQQILQVQQQQNLLLELRKRQQTNEILAAVQRRVPTFPTPRPNIFLSEPSQSVSLIHRERVQAEDPILPVADREPSRREAAPAGSGAAKKENSVLFNLGSPERDRMLPFYDVLQLPNMHLFRAPVAKACVRGVPKAFPYKLHRILDGMDDSIITWLPHGRAFRVWDREQLARGLHRFCNQSHWSSFRRQLNIYGFQRQGNVYAHELFVRDHPGLCQFMQRVGVAKRSATAFPNLDSLEPVRTSRKAPVLAHAMLVVG